MSKVKPLKAKIHTLGQLQLETLDLIRKLRFQLQRQAHEDGMSDSEFLEEIVQPLEDKIYQDREMARKQRGVKCTFCAGVGCVNGGNCPRCGGSGRLSV